MQLHNRKPKWLRPIDESIVFTPERWPHRELFSRLTALSIIFAFIVFRIVRFEHFPQFFDQAIQFYGAFVDQQRNPIYGAMDIRMIWGVKAGVWAIETAIYLGYVISYVSRTKPISVAKGTLEVGFPILVAGLPVLMSFMPYTLPQWLPFTSAYHLIFYLTIMGFIAVGGIINVIGLLTMRRAFTIMSEARTLVTTGIFRYVRHPLYTGHFIMFFGSLLLRLHWASVALYIVFLVGQVYRAQIEERKLCRAFEAYHAYRQRTGMFIPRLAVKVKGA